MGRTLLPSCCSALRYSGFTHTHPSAVCAHPRNIKTRQFMQVSVLTIDTSGACW